MDLIFFLISDIAIFVLKRDQGRSDGGYIGIYTLPENYFVH